MDNFGIPALRERLNQRKGQFAEIAQRAGVSYSWLTKFAAAKKNNPTLASLEKLVAALDSSNAPISESQQDAA